MKKTIGGDRLGSGNNMKVELHNYERSTHDLGYIWRSTMACGTLVPFLKEVGLPGDTFDIKLDCDIKTHPTIGPLFGSFKVQLDIFIAPVRLYQAQLHNNKVGIGLNMAAIKLPTITLEAYVPYVPTTPDLDNTHINPSAILSYLGIRGVGVTGVADITRDFCAIPLLMYWDTYKNYYANKQEEVGAVIHTPVIPLVTTVSQVQINGTAVSTPPAAPVVVTTNIGSLMVITYAGARPNPETIIIVDKYGNRIPASQWGDIVGETATTITFEYNYARFGYNVWTYWQYRQTNEIPYGPIAIQTFDLVNIDEMREEIMAAVTSATAFDVNDLVLDPYSLILNRPGGDENQPSLRAPQEGLALKTYQSDLFNNWIQTEWIDGVGGINEITAIDTSSGSFTIDELQLKRKVYDMLNRIAISGGTYDDWMDAVWTHDRYTRCETPMYMGGLIKELVFQEVVSNAEAQNTNGTQPLGTLAGKGIMGKKHKGGNVTVKVDEPSYIMGIISLTPRIDYSQGNKWDVTLATMDDFHKPALDEIGFQELITEQMAWWSTIHDGTNWVQRSAGKQPAWINYMTNVNEVRGNFAIATNEMFMTLNRRYEPDAGATYQIVDLTTYIDPVKYNHIFADTRLDAQNFWAQIAVDMTVRRKMSAKIMPNL